MKISDMLFYVVVIICVVFLVFSLGSAIATKDIETAKTSLFWIAIALGTIYIYNDAI